MIPYHHCAARGMTIGRTAELFGVSYSVVFSAATRLGLKFVRDNGYQQEISEASARKYRECAAAGMTQAGTARRLQLTRAAVSYAAKRHNIEFAKC